MFSKYLDIESNVHFQGNPVDYYRALLAKEVHDSWVSFNSGHREDRLVHYIRACGGYGDLEKVIERIEEAGLFRIMESGNNEGDNFNYVFADKETVAQIDCYENSVNFTVNGLDKQKVGTLVAAVENLLEKEPPKGSVMMLAHSRGDFFLTELGEIDCPLERGNYTDKIVAQYDNVIADLETDTPGGRLTLLDGVPGSGKSFLIRGIISQVKALFIYIPASVSGAITGPDIIPTFLRERERNVPIVLIMEDADATIATRQIDNVGRLSDLLNMSDGILGEMADIRILATTNQKSTDIDEAVKRAGRVNEHIQFTVLGQPHAESVFRRLTGIDGDDNDGIRHIRDAINTGKHSLASIYKLARDHGWRPPATKKAKRHQFHGVSRALRELEYYGDLS